MKNLRLEAAIVALGIVALGVCLFFGIGKMVDSKRTVSVRGLAEREVKANKVTWPMHFMEMGNDLPSIYEQMDEKSQNVVDFLTGKGIGRDEILVGAPEVADRLTERYRDNSQPLATRYFVSYVITVSTDKVDLVREIIGAQGELLKQGIAVVGDWENRPAYEFTGLNDIKPAMIEEATRNARTAAEKFASDSDSKLGGIVTASQGQFSIDDRDGYTPHIKSVRVVTYVTYQLRD